MTERWMAEGWCMVGRFGPLRTGAWILTHRGAAVLLEAPPSDEGEETAGDAFGRVLAAIHARPLFLTFTHDHWDHTLGYKGVRKVFPHLPVAVHRSFTRGRWKGPFDEVWDEEERVVDLGGEPLVMISAPKHSPSDVILVFRGVAMTGDWALGPHPDANGSVAVRDKLRSLSRLKSFLLRNGYRVHTALSVHGNEVRRAIDFVGLLDEMHAYWSARA